jgi:hypothetical protein
MEKDGRDEKDEQDLARISHRCPTRPFCVARSKPSEGEVSGKALATGLTEQHPSQNTGG